jgi:curli biogenesis system outer membrane secretion channel CsgG
MRRNFLTLISGVVFAVLAGSRLAAQDNSNLPTCFVAPFSGDTTAIQYWQPAMGEGLGEMLTTELGKINKFQMLEVNQIGDLKNEINMGADGWVDQAQKVDKGGFAAADFMFTAKVTRFGNKESHIGLGGFAPGNLGNLGLHQTVADVRIDWRLVDVATRKIVKTGSSSAQEKGGGFDVGSNIGGNGGNISMGNHEFMDSALGHATEKTLQQIISDVQGTTLPESGRVKQKAGLTAKASAANDALKHTPGKVLAVASKDTIIVSLGSKEGFKEGDKLELYQTNDVKDDKGNVVFTDEKLVGELTILSVQEDRSRASYSGDLNIQQGWTVKAK